MKNFQTLEQNRKKYKDVEWLSSNGKSTKVLGMKQECILNILRTIPNKIAIAERYPDIYEFQTWNNVSYRRWEQYFLNEYFYQEAVLSHQFNDALEQSSTDNSWYYNDDVPI
jgi:hypothetical protein